MNAITKTATTLATVRPVLVPQTFDQLVRFADLAAGTDMVPKAFMGKPGNIMLAVQMGSELGLSPMQSLTSIAVINGRPGVWGDGLIGICRQSPLCQDIQESITGEGDARVAVCIAIRRGSSPCTGRFSVADAKRAGLWQTEAKVRRKGREGSTYEADNDSPWFRYPDRMLQNRARGFALRDAFPDLLRGLKTVEELRDTPADTYRGTTLEHTPAPPPARPDTGATLGDDIPERVMQAPAQPKRTARDWLADMALRLAAAPDFPTLDAIVVSSEVKRVADRLTNGALEEWESLLAENVARLNQPAHDPETGEVAEAEFPGDRA